MDFKKLDELQRLMKTIEQQQKMLGPSFDALQKMDLALVRQMAQVTEAYEKQSRILGMSLKQAMEMVDQKKALLAYGTDFTSLTRAVVESTLSTQCNAAFEPAWEVVKQTKRILAKATVPSLAAIEASMKGALSGMDAFRDYEKYFSGVLLGHIGHFAAAAVAGEDVTQSVEAIEDFLQGEIEKSSKDKITRDAYHQIFSDLLAILLCILQLILSNRSEKRIIEQQKQSETLMIERFDRLETRIKEIQGSQLTETADRLRITNAQTLRVRQEPSADAVVIATLGQNSLVRVKAEHARWAFVEYFDFNMGKTAEGWVWKQYLRKLPDELKK